MDINKKCPECGSSEIAEGKFSAVLVPIDEIFSTGSKMIAEVCTNCGLIINLRVRNPEKFK